ncbi:MAG TPA: NAD(P)/FAD-dependent oxidoreductase [Vicinamibacterales bacterium]|nr:NAD(P)/FAD-dependent oxidoreductase [Vicinamibacterales bacterium]
MIDCDALVVGGGPAGSTCARILKNAGLDVVVADRARFPRDKVCAGWLTPRVFALLDLDPDDYRSAGLTLQEIDAFRTGVIGGTTIETRYPGVVSYAIRRCEFDAFLLRRSGARVLEDTPIAAFRRDGDAWIVNERLRTPLIVGAGGHLCPVARHLRGKPDTRQPVVAKEAEFLYGDGDDRHARAPELLFCRDMQGYAWCVRKGRYLNVGIGRRDPHAFGAHIKGFMTLLRANGIDADETQVKWRGHAYFAAGVGPRPLVGPGALVVGDAAGLAYPESGEGICPAIESGRRAAETIVAAHGRYSLDALQPYEAAITRQHPASWPQPAPIRAVSAAAGRVLLGSRAFTRRILLDRWFLRSPGGVNCVETARNRQKPAIPAATSTL